MWPASCPSRAGTDGLVGVQQSGVDALLQTPGGLASRGLFGKRSVSGSSADLRDADRAFSGDWLSGPTERVPRACL